MRVHLLKPDPIETLTPLGLLIMRQTDNILPQEMGPKYHVNVAFDGGGTGGVVALGYGDVLKKEGLFDLAETASGVSIGATIVAVAITDQIAETYDVIVEQFAERRFIDKKRMLLGQPMVDLRTLENIIGHETPIDVHALAISAMDLYFSVTDLTHYQMEIITKSEVDEHDMIEWLMRAMHLPRIAGKPRHKDGISWADGGLSTLDTPDIALSKGATHVLNITNKPAAGYGGINHELTTFVGRWIASHGDREGLEKFREFSKRQDASLRAGAPSTVQRLHPSNEHELPGVLCQDKRLLKRGFIVGQNAAWAAVNKPEMLVDLDKQRAPGKTVFDNLSDIALRTIYKYLP
jgi:predicted patatin/cPLA2 family phospholipase